MDKQREKLIELINSAPKIPHIMGGRATEKTFQTTQNIADHLLANGVIVPPCKVGDKIYIIGDNLAEDVRRDKPIEVEVEGFIFDRGNKIVKIVFWESWLGKFIPIEDWNKTAFANFEDAEKALKNGGQLICSDL